MPGRVGGTVPRRGKVDRHLLSPSFPLSLFSYLLPASFVPVLLFSIIFVVLKLYIFWLSSNLFFCGSFIVIILLIPVCGIVYLVE